MINIKNKQYQFSLFSFITFIILSFSSCKSEDHSQVLMGGASVKVNISSETKSEIITKADNKQIKSTLIGSSSQKMTQPLGAGNSIDITLTSVSSIPPVGNTGSHSGNNKATTVQQPLAPGTQYSLIIYDQAGAFIKEQIFTYGQESTASEIRLDAGKTYTFVATSINSTSSTPKISDINNLSTAVVGNISTNLLYFKSTVTLTEGNNNLNVILRHQYSEIRTILELDENTTGKIHALTNPTFNATYSSATLKLSDGVITYNGLPRDNAIVFPAFKSAVRSITSNSTLLINPITSTAVLNFGSLNVDGEIKRDVKVTNLRIIPGHRYDLVLKLKTCTQDVSGTDGLDWNYARALGDCTDGNRGCKNGIIKDGVFYANGKTISKSFTAPSADYGYVLNLTKLDNSFNMELNNVQMASKEIQFQLNALSPQNIEFADGSKYQGINTEGGGNVPPIFSMEGTDANPLIKIVISRFGEVQMYGSKKSNGPLYPLVLTNDTFFNKFNWNGNGINEVIVTQLVDRVTFLKGNGAGKKRISCN